MAKISAVVNTYNEEKKLSRALSSLKGFASEIVVVDMMSTDKTREIAKKYNARVFKHRKISYVEPARNFAIEKAKYDWVFILDADEEIPDALKIYLKKEIKSANRWTAPNFYRIPRRNIIFGKWMKHAGWWPDYNIRFFKRGTVSWNEIIHSVPATSGKGIDIPSNGELGIKHRHYSSLEEYMTRMNRYTTIQARQLNKKGVDFSWKDLITKPTAEFLRRYFAEEGFKDGLHGLNLSLLQAFSEVVLYSKLWQKQDFKKRKIDVRDVEETIIKSYKDFSWWIITSKISISTKLINKLWLKIKRKLKYQ
ncbi:MAG: glycosyltransferase family 2 protein [bacterium]|nr:glycosyltransferase family 2 protein [bacterium]